MAAPVSDGTVFVPGVPAPQGSAKAFVVKGRAVVTSDNKNTMPWRAQMSAFLAIDVGVEILHPSGPIGVQLEFLMPRRAAEPKRTTPPHTRKPDIDKLARAALDAMTGVVFTDDNQVTHLEVKKRTTEAGEQPGAFISWWQK